MRSIEKLVIVLIVLVFPEVFNQAAKLRTLRMARCQDGETFAVMATNPKVRHDVKLDLMLIEADRVCSDLVWLPDDKLVDGISFDDWGNPEAFRVMKYHPGDIRYAPGEEAVIVPAEYMLHIFRQDRPGLHRGVPELTAALPLFAQLRRYNLAVLSAAEAAADFAAVCASTLSLSAISAATAAITSCCPVASAEA